MIQFRFSNYAARYSMADQEIQCREVTGLLGDLIEGDLSDTRERLVQTHLRSCAHCRRIHEELLLTISLLNRLPKHVPRSTSAEPSNPEDKNP